MTPSQMWELLGAPMTEGFNATQRELEILELRKENARLRNALSFYADGRRYQGANQRPIPDDPFAKPDAVYILDVTRDHGSIATAALASEERHSG